MGIKRIFCFRLFSGIIFPQAPENPIRGILDLFAKICRDIRKSRCTTGINNTGGKFAAGVNYTGGKFATGISDTGAKFYQWKFAADGNDTGARQIMGTVSDCLHLKGTVS